MTDTAFIPDYENLLTPKGYMSFIKYISPLMRDLYALTMAHGRRDTGLCREETQRLPHVLPHANQ